MRNILDSRRNIFLIALFVIVAGCSGMKQRTVESFPPQAPVVESEFRAAWVATVANIDWPSSPGLSTEDQQREAIAILDVLSDLNFNAAVFQVRPQCDAFYKSDLEPWSYYLTGEQGKAPDPYYDPLTFWVEESHKRGIELHVWFNPYRAHHPIGGEISEGSIVKRRPDLAKELKGGYWWLDPAKQGTQDHSIAVVMDVLERYDIDGIHFDDYFYPYPSYNGGEDFPDDDSWAEYIEDGGKLEKNDWRRYHVNRFIKRLYREIKKKKSHVKFGLSPFGIWRPYSPPSIRGFDQHEQLFADARLWLNKGWVDYYSPQLYWPVNQIPQSYPVLVGWWHRQNLKGRNLWPGLYTGRVVGERGVDNNISQIMITRGFEESQSGNIHFSMKALMGNISGIGDALLAGPYKNEALVPTSPWLDKKAPAPPEVSVVKESESLKLSWSHDDPADVFRWVVYYKYDDVWSYDIFDRDDRNSSVLLSTGDEEDRHSLVEIAVSVVDRMGNESTKQFLDIAQ